MTPPGRTRYCDAATHLWGQRTDTVNDDSDGGGSSEVSDGTGVAEATLRTSSATMCVFGESTGDGLGIRR